MKLCCSCSGVSGSVGRTPDRNGSCCQAKTGTAEKNSSTHEMKQVIILFISEIVVREIVATIGAAKRITVIEYIRNHGCFPLQERVNTGSFGIVFPGWASDSAGECGLAKVRSRGILRGDVGFSQGSLVHVVGSKRVALFM